VVAVAVILIAATVLIVILLVARGIEKEAARALAAGARIKANTDALFLLGGARDALEDLRGHALAIEAKGAHLAGAVHDTAAGGGATRATQP
jgi:hypothetical protein